MLEDGEFGDPPKDGEILSFLAKAGLDKARPNARKRSVYGDIIHDAIIQDAL